MSLDWSTLVKNLSRVFMSFCFLFIFCFIVFWSFNCMMYDVYDVYLHVDGNFFGTVIALVDFIASAVHAPAYTITTMGTIWDRWTKRHLAHSASGLFWNIKFLILGIVSSCQGPITWRWISQMALIRRSELPTGRMDPRVGSGRVTILPDFGGSGRVSTSDFLVFYWLFLGTKIDVNLRILHSIFYDIWYNN